MQYLMIGQQATSKLLLLAFQRAHQTDQTNSLAAELRALSLPCQSISQQAKTWLQLLACKESSNYSGENSCQ
jgi:hypothetical protein